jgi:hypothetical protein
MTTMAEANTVARDTWPRRVQRAADLAAIDTPSRRHSPYVGAHLRGSVERTYLRGDCLLGDNPRLWQATRLYGSSVAGGLAATATHPVHSRARRRSGRLEAAACECCALTHPSRPFVLWQCATRRRPSEGLGNAYAVHTDQWELALDAGTRPL